MKNLNSLNFERDKIINIYKYLVFLIPIFIILGNFLVNSVVILGLLSLIYYSIRSKSLIFFNKKELKLISLIFLYLIASSIISGEIYSIEASLRYLRFLPFIIILFLYFNLNNSFESNFIKFFNITLIFIVIDGIFQYFYGTNLIGIDKVKPHRISGFFKDELILGSFLSKYIFLFFIYFACFKKDNYILFSIILISIIFLTYVSGERTAFFSIVLFSLLALIKIFKFRITVFISLIALFIILLTTSIDETIKERMVNKTLFQTKILKEWKNPKKILIFSDAHNSHYQSAYLMFKKGNLKEKLFGRGIKSFKINCSIKKFCDTLGGCCSTHPHNLFFQIIAEIGLIGFAIYLYFYLFLIQNLFRSFMGDKNTKFYVINLALFVNFLPIVPSGNLFGTYMTLNFAILISYSIHIFDKYEY
tara:strand:+ start:1019 stop:2275 length:1257 start_codon:yes stop_codon:yes gene_type:complete